MGDNLFLGCDCRSAFHPLALYPGQGLGGYTNSGHEAGLRYVLDEMPLYPRTTSAFILMQIVFFCANKGSI